MTTQPKFSITPQEYLQQERASEIRHEYFNGEIFAMAGASERHNLIVANALASLHGQIRRRPCRVYPSDMRVKIMRTGLYTYPDLTVLCGESRFEDEHRDVLLNPTVILEVLSPSTERYDRGKKFQHYRTIKSLQEYVLIASESMHLEHYLRQAGDQWLFSEVSAADGLLHLPSIGCDLAVADVYEKVELDGEVSE